MFDKKIIFIIFLVIAIMGSISLVSAIDLTDDVVNASVDDVGSGDILEIESDGVCLESSKKGTFTELQNKIDKASKGSTIYLDKDFYYNDGFESSVGINISKQLTIDGKGHTIDGLCSSPLILINKVNNVVLKNIVFKNGRDCEIGNVGIFSSDNVQIKNCNFYENYADYGGSVFLDNCRGSSFVGCNFYDGYADYGGSVFLGNCYGSSFIGCEFIGNDGMYGGSVFLDNCQDSSFKKCNFDSNGAYMNGAAVYLSDSSSSFNNCVFNQDSLVDYDDFNWDYVNEDVWSNGGAIFSIHSVLNILNTDFSSNGAGMAGGDIYSQYCMLFLENSTFSDSYAYGFGGSLSFNNDYVQLKDCVFDDCISTYHGGGAIYCIDSMLKSFSTDFNDCYSYYGGAICSINSDLDIQNNNFYSNRAGTLGGSIYTIYGTLNVEESIFSRSSGVKGGVMYIVSPQKINNITNNYFLYSSAKIASKIYIDGYYGEIPESGNIYEDIYFIYANFTGELNETSLYSSTSNILTYVVSNSEDHMYNLSFYNELRDNFISNVNYATWEDHFNIFDENWSFPFIFLNSYNYSDPKIDYDLGYYYNEFYDSSTLVEPYIFNLNGDMLNALSVLSIIDTSDIKGLNPDFYYLTYSSIMYNDNGWSIYPSDDERNITVFDKYGGKAYYWYHQIIPDEFNLYQIKGKFSFNFDDRKLFYNHGNSLEQKANKYAVSLFNPEYSWDNLYFDDYYDSRNYGYITPVKNQGIGSNCWAFAGVATLEACIKKMTGYEYDLSENNAKNLMATSSIYGLNIDPNAGGYDTMFMSYLTSWLGPVGEEYDEYNSISHLSIPFWSIIHIQDIVFLSPRKNSLDNYEYKSYIMNCGAVAVTINWTDDEGYKGFHSISIVGWDDNYCDIDSLGNYAEGAWIFKNSWGDYWEEEGFGYLSYNQKLSSEIAPYLHSYTFVFNNNDVGYQDCYQYDFAGVTDFLCDNNDFVYYKNKFVARDDEFLYAFSTYFEKPTYFTYSVRINGKDIAVSEDNVPVENSIYYATAGYHTISLGYNLTLKYGDEFEIVIKLINNGINYIPVCQADELYKLSYPSNVSFISYNGRDWFDLYDLNSIKKFAYWGNKSNTCQVACIKAFTAFWRNNSFNMSTTYANGKIDNKVYYIFPIKENLSSVGRNLTIYCESLKQYSDRDDFLELNINDEIIYLKVTSGYAHLNLDDWSEGYYKCSAKLKSNYFTSNALSFDFILLDDLYAPFSQLNKIINNGSEESTITLDRNYCWDVDFKEPYILINNSLTIDGKGYSLNGLFKSGIFKINPNCNVTLKNIHFMNGNSSDDFGAIFSSGNLTVINCSFSDNFANFGGAIYSLGECSILNSAFNNNNAKYYGGSVYSRNVLNITDSSFKSDETREIVYFTYDDNGDLYLKNNKMLAGTNNAATILFDDDKSHKFPLYLVFTNDKIIKGKYVDLCQIVDEAGNKFRMGDVNVTLTNQISAINLKIEYNSALGGYVFDTSYLDYGDYKLTGNLFKAYSGEYIVKDGILCVVKKSVLKSAGLVKVYGKGNKLTVTLKDEDGKVIVNTYITVKLNGKEIKIKTNSKGQVRLAINLVPKTYTASISFAGNSKYSSANIKVKVIIKKATPKLTAKKKSFKLKTKIKKYTIVLKNNLGKVMKNTKVVLKINGKTYMAKTNSKGKATFKIKNLKKNGTFKATIKYAGSKYYNSKSVNVKITVK